VASVAFAVHKPAPKAVAVATVDRRSLNRAKNVTRPNFARAKAPVAPAAHAAPAAPAAPAMAKTGTDDWESF